MKLTEKVPQLQRGMDWSNIFSEDGEEEGRWEIKSGGTRTTFLQALEGSYTPAIAYAFTVNYILGVGVLGMPYAFLKAGVVLASATIILTSLITYATVIWVANAAYWGMQARVLQRGNPFRSPIQLQRHTDESGNAADSVMSRSSSSSSLVDRIETHFNYSSIGQLDDSPSRAALARSKSRSPRRRTTPRATQQEAPEVEPEVSQLVQEFLGGRAQSCFQVALALLTYSGLVAYTQVFVQSFVSQLWRGTGPLLPTVFFSLAVVPLSCLNLEEQVHGQVVMSVLRFVSLALLFVGLLVAIYMPSPDAAHKPAFAQSGPDMPLANLSGFGLMFSTGVFSQLFQHSVPGLMRPLSAEHKGRVPQIFAWALISTCTCYIATGVIACWHLGSEIQQSVNLNFVGFTWGLPQGSRFEGAAKTVSMLVVLFPAMDTISIFPLIANTLGSNLHTSFPLLLKAPAERLQKLWGVAASEEAPADQLAAEIRMSEVLWRVLASVPPIVASMFITDLSLTLQLAGICGVVVALVIPALLQIAVARRVADTSLVLPIHPYQVGSGELLPKCVIVFSVLAIAVCLWQLLPMLAKA